MDERTYPLKLSMQEITSKIFAGSLDITEFRKETHFEEILKDVLYSIAEQTYSNMYQKYGKYAIVSYYATKKNSLFVTATYGATEKECLYTHAMKDVIFESPDPLYTFTFDQGQSILSKIEQDGSETTYYSLLGFRSLTAVITFCKASEHILKDAETEVYEYKDAYYIHLIYKAQKTAAWLSTMSGELDAKPKSLSMLNTLQEHGKKYGWNAGQLANI